MKIIKPKKSEQQVKMLFQVMDSDGDGKISKFSVLYQYSPYCVLNSSILLYNVFII